MRRVRTLILALAALGLAFACLSCSGKKEAEPTAPARLESYELRGLTFTYYLIPAGLTEEKLVSTAQALHSREPKAQLVLVDDRSGLEAYVRYVLAISRGEAEPPFPKDWADRHIIANVQLYLSGKWKLLRGYGYDEIVELK